MEEKGFKVYGYRWVVLVAFMLVVVMNQLSWITFASITSEAVRYYHVSEILIGLLSLCFMAVYIVVSIPASWLIDTRGIRAAVGVGAVLTGLFGLLRGLTARSYGMVLLSQVGIAVGQPFVLNAITKIAARWFPMRERATASGLGTLAIYLGILLGLALTPLLVMRLSIRGMLVAYGIAALLAAGVFFGLVRERPPSPPCPPDQESRSLVFDGLRLILRKRDFKFLMVIFFVGLGVFNAVTTWIENILAPRGFSPLQAGIGGGLMIVGGILGALIMPSLSDRTRRRIPFIFLSLAGAIVGLVGITYAANTWLLLASALVFGFFLLSAGPVGFQYGAEVSYPAPEGTSNGLLLLMGQISGIIFILGLDSFKSHRTGSMTSPLIVLIALMGLSLALCTLLKESALINEYKGR